MSIARPSDSQVRFTAVRKESVRASFGAFLDSCRQLLTDDYVENSSAVLDRYSRSCSNESVRSQAVIRPSSTEEVQSVVRLASQHRVHLYSISGGCNWGFGDACPTTSNQVVLDLSRMNRITTADVELGAFTVEPGVTQQQMYEYLQSNQIPFWYDASGAGPTASLIGNLMERGYGHTPLGERFQNTCNYHVVLADGSLIKTGFGEDEGCAVKDLFKSGTGPSLDGLFTQSNFGIVTRATFWMTRIPEHFEAYAFQFESDDQLEDAVAALQPLRASGSLSSTLHIGNDFRVLSGLTQFPYANSDGSTSVCLNVREKLKRDFGVAAWNGLGAYYGTKCGVRGFHAELKRALRGITSPIFLTDRKLSIGKWFFGNCSRIPVCRRWLSKFHSAEKVMDLLKGKPVADHLAGAAWRSRTPWDPCQPTPIQRGDGLYWYTPTIPCKSQDVRRINTILTQTFERYHLEPMVTYIMINGRSMVCPITVSYDANDSGQSHRARKCWDELRTECEVNGYPSYRAASFLQRSSPAISQILKSTLDPNSILAPGRYGLGSICNEP